MCPKRCKKKYRVVLTGGASPINGDRVWSQGNVYCPHAGGSVLLEFLILLVERWVQHVSTSTPSSYVGGEHRRRSSHYIHLVTLHVRDAHSLAYGPPRESTCPFFNGLLAAELLIKSQYCWYYSLGMWARIAASAVSQCWEHSSSRSRMARINDALDHSKKEKNYNRKIRLKM